MFIPIIEEVPINQNWGIKRIACNTWAWIITDSKGVFFEAWMGSGWLRWLWLKDYPWCVHSFSRFEWKFGTQKGFIFWKRWSVSGKNQVMPGLFLTTKQDWIGLTLPSPRPSEGFLCPYLFLGSASMSKLVFTFKHRSLQDQPVHQMGRRWIIASKARWQVWCARNTKFGFQKKINTNEEEYWEEGNGFLEDSMFFWED